MLGATIYHEGCNGIGGKLVQSFHLPKCEQPHYISKTGLNNINKSIQSWKNNRSGALLVCKRWSNCHHSIPLSNSATRRFFPHHKLNVVHDPDQTTGLTTLASETFSSHCCVYPLYNIVTTVLHCTHVGPVRRPKESPGPNGQIRLTRRHLTSDL